METTSTKKEIKTGSKKSQHSSIRVAKETGRAVLQQLAQLNKKDYGKRVKSDQLIALAMSLIKSEHILMLQENSLSNQDRFEREYNTYTSVHENISKDEYLGRVMRREILSSIKPS